MITKIKEQIVSEVLPKYESFCNNIDLELSNNYSDSKFVHFSPTLCLKVLSATPNPDEFMDLKYDIYQIIEKHTNKKAILANEWKLKSKYER